MEFPQAVLSDVQGLNIMMVLDNLERIVKLWPDDDCPWGIEVKEELHSAVVELSKFVDEVTDLHSDVDDKGRLLCGEASFWEFMHDPCLNLDCHNQDCFGELCCDEGICLDSLVSCPDPRGCLQLAIDVSFSCS